MIVHGLSTLIKLTLHEAARRRILLGLTVFGIAFVIVFAIGFHFIAREVGAERDTTLLEKRGILTFFVMAGLYVVNFLTLMTAVLMPIDTLSGEIASGTMQTVASKPIARSTIVVGKWAAHAIVLALYIGLMAGGVILAARVMAGIMPPNLERGLALILLEGLVLMTLCMACGARFSTITNGVIVFGLYGIALVGGWAEQIGTMAGNEAARYLGTLASLLMPSEAMWQLAAWHMQPAVTRAITMTPFTPASVPNGTMVAWAAGYVVVALFLAVRGLERRGL